MIRIYSIILINLFFISCIDLITEEEYYESIHLKQTGWLEFYENTVEENIQLEQNFTFQVWFSGQALSELNAPCILTINDEQWDLSIYRNPNVNNLLMIYLNQELTAEIEIENVDLDNENNFYLLSVVIDNQTISIYFNESQVFQDTINDSNNPTMIVGAYKMDNAISNLWYGYIDEVRLWNESLTASIINFHNEYKYKVSSSYDDEYLDALIGLWDFRVNTIGDSPNNTFQDINEHNTYTIIYNLGSTSSELSTNGR
tara:strand:- start:230 stop:1003 length:774 start_codon:yes stop_codon:yes gene_type:complete